MVVKLFISPINYTIENLYKKQDDEYLIGVDKGAFYALQSGLKLDRVIGDFDSTTEEEFNYIKDHVKDIDIFPAQKDETDSYMALKAALLLNPDEIIIYGGIGERFDHTYGNVLLLKQGPITMVTDHSEMTMLSPGSYRVDNPHHYISFFAIEDVKQLTLEGFRYELKNYNLTIDDPLCISNQGAGKVSFKEGLLLIVKSNDQ